MDHHPNTTTITQSHKTTATSHTKIRRLLEILVAVSLFSWSSTRLPSSLNLASQFLVQAFHYLSNPHITFLVGNVIVLVIVLLSRQNTVENDAFDFSDEITPPTLAAIETEKETETETEKETETETEFVDKEMVVAENNNNDNDDNDNDKNVVVREEQCEAVVAAMEDAEKAIERRRGGGGFSRTKSEKVTRREEYYSQERIYRRSETVMVMSDERRRRRAVTSFDTVDTLSNEEFRRTVEDVIAEHRRRLWSQKEHGHEHEHEQ